MILLLGSAVFMLFANPSLYAEEFREWTNTAGKKIFARMVDLDSNKKTVVLVRSDSAKFEIAIESLSLDDQTYIKEKSVKYSWSKIDPENPNSDIYKELIDEFRDDQLIVRDSSEAGGDPIPLQFGDPIGYQERLHVSLEEHPVEIAVDNRGDVVYFTQPNQRQSFLNVTTAERQTIMAYDNNEFLPKGIKQPKLSLQGGITPIQNGFLVQGSYDSKTGLYLFRLHNQYPVMENWKEEVGLSRLGRTQFLESFEEDALIVINGFRIREIDHNMLPEVEAEELMEFRLTVNLVLSPTKYLTTNPGSFSDSLAMYLVDLEKATISMLGKPEPRIASGSPFWMCTVSPDGSKVVRYDRRKKTLMFLKIDGVNS